MHSNTDFIIATSMIHTEDEPEEDFKRKRHQEHVQIRMKNRKVIFKGNRMFSKEQLKEGDANEVNDISTRNENQCNKKEQEQASYQVPREETTPRRVLKLLTIQARAQQLYGPKPNPSKEWQIQPSHQIVIVDKQISDIIYQIIKCKYTLQDLQQAIQFVQMPEQVYNIHKGVIVFRKLLSYQDSPHQQILNKIIDHDLITVFINMIKQDVFKQLKLEALWIMTNIANGEHFYSEKIVQKGCIDIFIKILKEREEYIMDHALYVLGNLSADCDEYKEKIIESNGLHQIIQLGLNTTKKSLFESCVWATINLTNIETNKYEIAQSLEFICLALTSGFLNNSQSFSMAITCILRNTFEHLDLIARSGIAKYLIDTLRDVTLSSKDSFIILKILSKFTQGDECLSQILLNHNILSTFHQILLNDNQQLIDLTLYSLSNLAANKTSQIQLIFKQPDLISICQSFLIVGNQSIQNQACYIFHNLSLYGNRIEIFNLYQEIRAVQIILDIIVQENCTNILIHTALKLLIAVLDSGEYQKSNFDGKNIFREQILMNPLFQKLIAIRDNENKQIYNTFVFLIKEYFIEFCIEQSQSSHLI